MATDLAEIVRARCEAKIREGKRPSKADVEWYELTRDRYAYSTSKHARNAKGDIQFEEEVKHIDPYEAHRISIELAKHSRNVFPMGDGTVGSPSKDIPAPKPKGKS